MSARPAASFPFTAIVGQSDLKTALLLNAVDPRVGGVLIRGEKGTAKSTAVRALAHILPELDVVEDCRFGCDPGEPSAWCVECRTRRDEGRLPKHSRSPRLVELPVSATEDRLVGTLDFQAALKKGERTFHPGLLADANRGILYVDEVNLLDDHLVDTLLDAAAMGVNTVEREGVSFAHPARFVLIGTMNPEEGELRPQLLDRFGLCVDVDGVRDPESRVEIMRRRRDFEDDSAAFTARWRDSEDDMRSRIMRARLRLPSVTVAEEILYAIADLSIRANVDGHRADTVMARAVAALAAYEDRKLAELRDVERVAPLVLAHRLHRRPFDSVRSDAETMREALRRALGTDPGTTAENPGGAAPAPGDGQVSIFESLGSQAAADDAMQAPEAALEAGLDGARRSIAGRTQESVSDGSRGRYFRAEQAPPASASDIAIDATIRAAARAGSQGDGDLAINVAADHLHRKVRKRKVGSTIVFCVDASGSMGAAQRMEAAKGAVLDLLVDAYQRRDRVSMVSFRGDTAETVLAPTGSVELANLKLRTLPTGGATPLAHGLVKSMEVVDAELRREPDSIVWLVLVTDGRANVGLNGGLGSDDAREQARRLRSHAVNVLVVDTGAERGSAARELAEAAGAEYVRLSRLDATTFASAIKDRLAAAS